MPRISEFFGIVITMHFGDHPQPHFHARHAEFKVSIGIRSLKVLKGKFPPSRLRKVMEWASLHQDELLANWELAKKNLSLKAIEPLS